MKKADLQANISVMKQESVSLSKEISEKYKKIVELDEQFKAILERNEKALEDIKSKNDELDRKKKELETCKKTVDTHVLEAEAKVKEIEIQIKQKNKELAKINSWCLQGEDNFAILLKKHAEIQSDIEKGNNTLLHIERLSYAKIQLENDIDLLRKEMSSIKQALDQKITISNRLLQQEQEVLNRIRQERELEEIAFYNVREKKVRVEHDIEIYIGRASMIYQKAFPELEMKL